MRRGRLGSTALVSPALLWWAGLLVLPVGLVLAKSKHQAEAQKFLDWVLRPGSGKSVTELVLYKTPNEVAMKQVRKSLAKQYPNLAIPPKLLLTFQTERDLGKAQPLWSRTVSEIVG